MQIWELAALHPANAQAVDKATTYLARRVIASVVAGMADVRNGWKADISPRIVPTMSRDDFYEMALVCEHVFRTERPVRLVVRHRDLGWQMMCGNSDHDAEGRGSEVVHASHVFDQQPNLNSLRDLQPGALADWAGDAWQISYHND